MREWRLKRLRAGTPWLVLFCVTSCGGGRIPGAPPPSAWDAGADTTPDTDPICGTNKPLCTAVPYQAIPGATECDLRVYVNPGDRCVCDCATDVVGCGTHGSCIRRGANPPECRCDPQGGRFVGAHCDECAANLTGPDCTDGCWAGMVEADGGCKTPCEVAGIPCTINGYCADTVPATCVCYEGWAEPGCTECAPGYTKELVVGEYPGSLCTADCEDCPCGSCAPSRRCDRGLRPPACVCRSAYTEVDGNCVWHGMDLKLPPSTKSCGEWRFFAMAPQVSGGLDGLSVAVVDGKLLLHAERCGAVAAGTMVELPAADTMPGAALRIRYTATIDQLALVYLGGSLEVAPTGNAKTDWQVATRLQPVSSGDHFSEVCVPAWAAGERTGLLLWTTSADDCRNTSDFTITEVSLFSSTWCD